MAEIFKKIKILKRTLGKLKKKMEQTYYENLDEDQYPKYLARFYKKKTGLDLDWDNLVTYTEKMQWAKLYDKDPFKTDLSDKYLVRDWVRKKIGDEYLIPLLGVWDTFEEIDFSNLPNEFVLKTNQASGTNLIVKDKSKLNMQEAREFIEKSLKKNQAFSYGFQMHYEDIQPKIIAEEYIEDSDGNLNDYKFLCFHGQVYYCWVDVGRFDNHYRNVYDLDWNLQPWQQHTYDNTPYEVAKPDNFDEMINIASNLCKDFSHVRVDLYNVDGKIYFGEMTFSNGSGFSLIHPEEYNKMLGNLWTLPIEN